MSDKKMITINSKIKNVRVVNNAKNDPFMPEPAIEIMHEDIKRPDELRGSSYKIKPPNNEHALYLIINDIVLNKGTENESCHPFEVFINSKNMEHYQWVVALTLLISAIFKKGGDLSFLSRELKAVFDPRGGYFKKGGGYMPSLVAEIGTVIEEHLKYVGLNDIEPVIQEKETAIFPEDSITCLKCYVKAVVVTDGCRKCLNCDDSLCQ